MYYHEHQLPKLTAYKDWAPSRYDAKGLGLPEHQDWLVVMLKSDHDDDPLTESNWHVLTEELEGYDEEDCPSHEVHRFGHWTSSFDLLLVNPENEGAVDFAREAIASLEGYPVLNDEDYFERRQKAADEAWAYWSNQERAEKMRKSPPGWELDWTQLKAAVRGDFCPYDYSEVY